MSNKNKLSCDPSKNTARGNDYPERERASNLIKSPRDFDLGLAMTGSIRKEDIERILSIQNKSIKNFARTNELLGKFNDFSSSKYDVLQHMFLQHTRLLVDLKKDLTNVFLRIRRLKVRLQMQYHDAFEATFNLRGELEDRLEQEEASEPTYGYVKERTKNKKGKTKAKNDNKEEDKGMSKTQSKTSELVDSKIVRGSDRLGFESENPEVANNPVKIQNTALLNNADTMHDSKEDMECGKIPKTKSIKTDLCAMDETQFSANTETLVTNDLPECDERDKSETPCGNSNCTDIEVNKDSSDCSCEIKDEGKLKKATDDKKNLQGTDNEADQQNSNDRVFTQMKDCNKTSNVDNRDTNVIERDPEGTVEISNDTDDCANVKDDSLNQPSL